MLLSSFSSDAFKIAGACDVDVTNVGNNQEVDVGRGSSHDFSGWLWQENE